MRNIVADIFTSIGDHPPSTSADEKITTRCGTDYRIILDVSSDGRKQGDAALGSVNRSKQTVCIIICNKTDVISVAKTDVEYHGVDFVRPCLFSTCCGRRMTKEADMP